MSGPLWRDLSFLRQIGSLIKGYGDTFSYICVHTKTNVRSIGRSVVVFSRRAHYAGHTKRFSMGSSPLLLC